MNYIIIKIRDNTDNTTELVSNISNLFPIEGVWEQTEGIDIYVNDRKNEGVCDQIISYLTSNGVSIQSIAVETFEDEGIDWNAEWKKNYKPVKIADRLWVFPAWIPVPNELSDSLVIKIEPQMGFGTGTHETTQMMMQLLSKCKEKPRSVLDLGTGSGILAIQAKKQFPTCEIIAADIDPDAIDNAKLNEKLNHCQDIKWFVGSLEQMDEGLFDIILANINRVVLQTLIPLLVKKLTDKGVLLLSGILLEELHVIEQICLQEGFISTTTIRKNEWAACKWIRKK